MSYHHHHLLYPLFMLLALQSAPLLAAGLTESEALRLVLERPEFSTLQQARLDEAEADIVESATWSNPTLEFGQERNTASRERSWHLSQSLDISGRRGLREAAARHRLRATEADNRSRQNARAAELRLAFHALLLQQERARAVGAWAERFAQLDRVVGKLAKAGEISGYDRRRLAREQHHAAALLAEARAEEARRRTRLAALTGHEITGGVAGTLLPPEPPSLSELQASLAGRPEFAALGARIDAAETDSAAAQNNLPELTLGFGRKQLQDGPAHGTSNLMMLSLSLPLFDRQQARERQAAAQRQAARAELGLSRQQAEGELLGLHRQLGLLTTAASRYRSEAVAPSAELIRIAESAYRAGESTILELLDAYKGALETELTALDLEWKARSARIELDQLTESQPQ
uniref:Outer membrane efflux protein n=1 Tax=Sterolibacterium denitrificans TaxID=157592 RepID=A0A7Z7HS32_9PROT|nr:TolC family protein [Sterolibacterium denitrificans]SMB29000.1 putative Outer membrane efflux protein [Sterolibacterium denitrificans]